MLPVGNNKVELSVEIPRLQCKKCGAIKQPRICFADPKKHYTRSLERFVVDLCRVANIQDVAELTGSVGTLSRKSTSGIYVENANRLSFKKLVVLLSTKYILARNASSSLGNWRLQPKDWDVTKKRLRIPR